MEGLFGDGGTSGMARDRLGFAKAGATVCGIEQSGKSFGDESELGGRRRRSLDVAD